MSERQPKSGFQLVINYTLLISLVVAAVIVAGAVIYIQVTSRTESASRERATTTARYDPDCPYDSTESPFTVAVIQQQVVKNRTGNDASKYWDWFQISREIKESTYSADFNGDGDDSDIISPISREDILGSAPSSLSEVEGGIVSTGIDPEDELHARIPSTSLYPQMEIVVYRQEKCWTVRTR